MKKVEEMEKTFCRDFISDKNEFEPLEAAKQEIQAAKNDLEEILFNWKKNWNWRKSIRDLWLELTNISTDRGGTTFPPNKEIEHLKVSCLLIG